MKIVKPRYEILTPISEGGVKELQNLERAARTCYKSEGLIKEDGSSAKELIQKLIQSGHYAMLEHGGFSVRFIVDRASSHDFVRHRIASFAQESTRYCNYSKKKFGKEITVVDPGYFGEDNVNYSVWLAAMHSAEDGYFLLLDQGMSPQEASVVLPHSLKVEMVMTANYREWRHFFDLRARKNVRPQIQAVTIPLLQEMRKRIPILFDDVGEPEKDRYMTAEEFLTIYAPELMKRGEVQNEP